MPEIELLGGPLDGGKQEVPEDILTLQVNYMAPVPSWAKGSDLPKRTQERLIYQRKTATVFMFIGSTNA